MRLPDLSSAQLKANPFPLYARLRAEAPVAHMRYMFMPTWIVMRYDDVVVTLKDERFAKRFVPNLPLMTRAVTVTTQNLLNFDPPDHTRLRTLVSKAFTPRVVEQLRGRVASLSHELLDAAATRGSMDIIRDYALPIPLTISADLIGVPEEDRKQFGKWSRRFANATSGSIRDIPAAWASMISFGRYFRKLVAARRIEPKNDLTSALVQAEEAGDRLSEEELIAMLGLLLFAGYETTINLIASGALALMESPAQREKFVANPDLTESAIEELLRFTTPVDFASPRIAREDVTLAGTVIPRGSMVLAGLGSANRDESKFAEPDTLDITRANNRHLAFGAGIHFCLGAPLARVEGQIALTTLFKRFPDLRLTRPSATLRWRRSLAVRGLEQLPVLF